jgi:hypothetical protein
MFDAMPTKLRNAPPRLLDCCSTGCISRRASKAPGDSPTACGIIEINRVVLAVTKSEDDDSSKKWLEPENPS